MTATITLTRDTLGLLGGALLSRLTTGRTRSTRRLRSPGTRAAADAHAALAGLCATGRLLYRLGWQEQEPAPSSLAIGEPGEMRLVIDALSVELGTVAADAEMRRRLGEEQAALAAEHRWQAVHAALWRRQALAAARSSPTGQRSWHAVIWRVTRRRTPASHRSPRPGRLWPRSTRSTGSSPTSRPKTANYTTVAHAAPLPRAGRQQPPDVLVGKASTHDARQSPASPVGCCRQGPASQEAVLIS